MPILCTRASLPPPSVPEGDQPEENATEGEEPEVLKPTPLIRQACSCLTAILSFLFSDPKDNKESLALSATVMGLCIHSVRGIAAEIPLEQNTDSASQVKALPQSAAFCLTI